MPRVHRVGKCRKDQGRCAACGTEIVKGESYSWIQFRHGRPIKHCSKCAWRPSQLTQSLLGDIYSAKETAEDELAGWSADDGLDSVESLIDDLRSEVEDWMNERQDSFDAMPEQLQDSSSSAETLREYIDAAEGYMDALDSIDYPDEPERDEYETDGAYDDAVEEWADEVRSVTTDAIDSFDM